MINPGGIEQLIRPLDPVGLDTEVRRLRAAANGIRETGENVDTAWTHGLNPHVYDAPEGEQLRQAARPVETTTAEFAWQLWQVAGALDAYAAELSPIKARLQLLHFDARNLVAEIKAEGSDWTEDEDLVDRNNDLEAAVRGQMAALAAAEERCADKIYAAYGGKAPVPLCVDAPPAPPWGTPEKADLPWWEDAWNGAGRFLGGMWDVTWGGLSTLAGLQGGEKFADAWKGLGRLTLSSFIMTVPGGAGLLQFDPVRDMVWTSHRDAVKGLTAWDEWRRDPARAAGQVAGNALMLATLKKTGPRATTAAGRTAQAAARAGRAIDPVTHITWGTTRLRDLLRGHPARLDPDLPTLVRPGAGDFTTPGGGIGEVKHPSFGAPEHPPPVHPREPALAGTPPRHDPHPINSSNTPPPKVPDGDPPPPGGPRDTPPPTKDTDPANPTPSRTGDGLGGSPARGETPGSSAEPPTQDTRPGAAPDEGAPGAAIEHQTAARFEQLGLSAADAEGLSARVTQRGLSQHIDDLLAKSSDGRLPADEVAQALRDLERSMDSGKLHRDGFAQQLAQLNNAHDLTQFRESYAEVRAVREAIENADLAPRTQVLTNRAGGELVDLGDGTFVDIAPVHEADLLYKTSDGVVHIDEVKNTPSGFRNKMATPGQHHNLITWRNVDTANRAIGYRIMTESGWTEVFRVKPSLFVTMARSEVPVTIAGRTYSPAELLHIHQAVERKFQGWLQANPGAHPREFFGRPDMGTIESAMRSLDE